MRKLVCTAEQDLQKRRPEGARWIESYIGNRAEGKDLTGNHQADDKACPAGGCAAIHSRSHDDREQEEGADRLHGNGYDPATTRSVEVDSATEVRRTEARALRRSRPAKGEGNEERAQDATHELRDPVDRCLAPANAPGNGQ